MNIIKTLMLTAFALAGMTHTKMIEFTENPYEMQAPEEITAKVAAAVQEYGFTKDYEVTVPKKAGFDVNPWYHFAYSGVNQYTKNFLIGINPEWFLSLPEAQQKHFLFYSFATHDQGAVPLSVKIIPWIILLVVFAFMFFIGRTVLRPYSRLTSGALSFLIAMAIFSFVTTPLQNKLITDQALQHRMKIHALAIKKTGNKNAAIDYLKVMDQSMKQRAKDGDEFYIKIVPTLQTDVFIEYLSKI
jgi:hypothetical protein